MLLILTIITTCYNIMRGRSTNFPVAPPPPFHACLPARKRHHVRPLMNWILAALISAGFLGCYDLCTKHAVRQNAVLPVLFLANLCSAIIWLSLVAFQRLHPGTLPANLSVPHLNLVQHLQIAGKSLLVSVSWICTYFAVKHLPVSL